MGDAAKHIFDRRLLREIIDQFVIDRRVGGEDEEIFGTAREIEIRDERAHQPRFADAGGEREAERGEVPLKRFDTGIGFPDFSEKRRQIAWRAEIHMRQHIAENAQRQFLRPAQ